MSGWSKRLITAFMIGIGAGSPGNSLIGQAPFPTMANTPTFATPGALPGSSPTLGAPVPVLENTLQPSSQTPLIFSAGGTAYPASGASVIPTSSPVGASIKLTQGTAPLPPPPPPGIGTPAPLVLTPGGPTLPPPPVPGTTNPNLAWWEETKEALALNGFSKRKLFQSDHSFDVFSSPISSPFLAQDPRSLTQIKPMLLYNHIPSANPVFDGGGLFWFGVQASVAITEKLSVKIDKLGGISMSTTINEPGGEDLSGSSFSEFWLTPQWTFLRNDRTQTVMATGLQIQIPAGSDVGQNSGGATLNPYYSIAQNFWRTSYGSINFMGTIGVPISINGNRTTYFNTNLHVDYDVANWHKWYPTFEMNIMSFLGNGSVYDINTNSGDLFNVGATQVKGLTNLTLAPGLRYKFTENFQIGGACEFLCTSKRSMEDFRFMFDFIVRY